ncbi:MAG: P22 coat - protein 5 family protein [Hyphomicrobiaceae bacterium]|nr:P22 coat - protein 5 family protein [Anaerolineae bacterium]TXH09006.1 MAG: P22 coat - protein 5 family protein [Hyphomicrobiaceae bacterium]
MANTVTNLIPDAYVALDVVSRELTGMVNSVARDSSADAVALNQTVRSFITPANSAGGDFTPSMTLPSASDQTISNKAITISKSKYYPFSWTAEEEYAMDKGPGALNIKQDQIAQAIRAAVNAMETDLWTAAYQGASRAYGTAGTTPFGTAGDYSDAAQVRKILDDNGAPPTDRSLVINTTAGANIRGKQAQVQMYGSDSLLRQGVILDQAGFAVKESAAISAVTKGTGASYLVNNSGGYAIGATTIAADTGSGTILAGDTVTFASDTNKYVVTTALSGGSFVIAEPGLRKALADNAAITVGNDNTPNVALSRNAVLLATRLPIMGNDAGDHEVITDDRTGLSFMISNYKGVGMGVYWVQVCYGYKVLKPEHVALLLG